VAGVKKSNQAGCRGGGPLRQRKVLSRQGGSWWTEASHGTNRGVRRPTTDGRKGPEKQKSGQGNCPDRRLQRKGSTGLGASENKKKTQNCGDEERRRGSEDKQDAWGRKKRDGGIWHQNDKRRGKDNTDKGAYTRGVEKGSKRVLSRWIGVNGKNKNLTSATPASRPGELQVEMLSRALFKLKKKAGRGMVRGTEKGGGGRGRVATRA